MGNIIMASSSHDIAPPKQTWSFFIHELKNTYINVLEFYQTKSSLNNSEQNTLAQLKEYHLMMKDEAQKIINGDADKMDELQKDLQKSEFIKRLEPILANADREIAAYVSELTNTQPENKNSPIAKKELDDAVLIKEFLVEAKTRLSNLLTEKHREPEFLSKITANNSKSALKNAVTINIAEEIKSMMVNGEYIDLINSILHNCISNADSFSENGAINVKVGLVNHKLQIVITDNGPGMPEEVRKKLNKGENIKVEDQASASDNQTQQKQERESNGIGIAGVSELTRKIAGSLVVTTDRSNESHGSVFTWELPAERVLTQAKSVKQMETEAKALEAVKLPPDPDKLILYFIDDNKVNQKMGLSTIKRLLTKNGRSDIECRILKDPLELFKDLEDSKCNYSNIVGIICDENVEQYDTGPGIIVDAIKTHLATTVRLSVLSANTEERKYDGFTHMDKPISPTIIQQFLNDVYKAKPKVIVDSAAVSNSTFATSTTTLLSRLKEHGVKQPTDTGALSSIRSSQDTISKQIGNLSDLTAQRTSITPPPSLPTVNPIQAISIQKKSGIGSG
jgi:signal transduction histidine kinase